jgi:predicted porin
MMPKVLLIFSCLFYVGCSDAAEWSIKPVIVPTLEYDDNVFMSSSEQQESFKLSAEPTLELSYAEANQSLGLSAGYSIARYDQLSRLDEDDPFLKLSGSKSTELSTWAIDIGYSETASRNNAIENTGNFASTSVVTRQSISPSYQYSLTERDSLGISLSYTQREYSTNEFSDNVNKSVSSSWQHQFTERLSSSLTFSYSLYESGTSFSGSESDTYNVSLGASYLLSERWSVQGQFGARQLDSDRFNSGFKTTSSTRGSSFNLSANYTGDINSFRFSGSQSLNPSSSGDVNEQLSFSASWERSISETMDFTLSGSYRENVSASELSSNKRENISFKSSLVKNMSERTSLSLNYEYREQKITTEDSANSNAIYVTFNYEFDVYQVSR